MPTHRKPSDGIFALERRSQTVELSQSALRRAIEKKKSHATKKRNQSPQMDASISKAFSSVAIAAKSSHSSKLPQPKPPSLMAENPLRIDRPLQQSGVHTHNPKSRHVAKPRALFQSPRASAVRSPSSFTHTMPRAASQSEASQTAALPSQRFLYSPRYDPDDEAADMARLFPTAHTGDGPRVDNGRTLLHQRMESQRAIERTSPTPCRSPAPFPVDPATPDMPTQRLSPSRMPRARLTQDVQVTPTGDSLWRARRVNPGDEFGHHQHGNGRSHANEARRPTPSKAGRAKGRPRGISLFEDTEVTDVDLFQDLRVKVSSHAPEVDEFTRDYFERPDPARTPSTFHISRAPFLPVERAAVRDEADELAMGVADRHFENLRLRQGGGSRSFDLFQDDF
ncbi:hypothetical protein J8273_5873 [Carpediemonas membranifera]|uniref:Uncharacterized protein n=1 Tax=Carpediemonas membranifera TaxID=201153 RepID=A0A8J6B2A3_9EUKA|nr:hypothetical protein J8273_5873 [Carpediemonas membranifera]|eukprot:KAG9392734.1 hypothetical protein J8273_5873 [Carpediemonas membranifera]